MNNESDLNRERESKFFSNEEKKIVELQVDL